MKSFFEAERERIKVSVIAFLLKEKSKKQGNCLYSVADKYNAGKLKFGAFILSFNQLPLFAKGKFFAIVQGLNGFIGCQQWFCGLFGNDGTLIRQFSTVSVHENRQKRDNFEHHEF